MFNRFCSCFVEISFLQVVVCLEEPGVCVSSLDLWSACFAHLHCWLACPGLSLDGSVCWLKQLFAFLPVGCSDLAAPQLSLVLSGSLKV